MTLLFFYIKKGTMYLLPCLFFLKNNTHHLRKISKKAHDFSRGDELLDKYMYFF